MYKEFLEAVATYVGALNDAADKIDEKEHLTPHVNCVPVILDGDLEGFLMDEVGGLYQYVPANAAIKAWWAQKPSIF